MINQSLVENGPTDRDFVVGVAAEICALNAIAVAGFTHEEVFRAAKGAIEYKKSLGEPYYLVADISKVTHPLHPDSARNALHDLLDNLTVVYLMKREESEISILVEGEHSLVGSISGYLKDKEKWFKDHP